MITLDGKRMLERKSLHAHLKEKLNLPDNYGANLDALNDCLSDITLPGGILIVNAREMLDSCGVYGEKLIQVFEDNGILVELKNKEE